ncbi:MAG: hypothetical protein AMJ89_04915 [candidate division Zixibacteria bacterium SM23_73]|nr:MAG: hypothetical protein AMJ89_04915 [candidate division Zixibacteria bacterium SM23_73]
MEIIYTDHTRIRMNQRDITEADIKMTLGSPDQIFPSFGGRKCARKMIKGETLEVVFVKENDQTIVITTYWLEGD